MSGWLGVVVWLSGVQVKSQEFETILEVRGGVRAI